MKRIVALVLSISCVLMAASVARAQSDYPTKPVKIIVGFPSGTGIDIITRIYARKLEETLGQPFVVENRGGVSGNLAAAAVAKMAPDGYTLLSNGITQTISMSLFKNLTFDIVKDFEPVGFIGSTPSILAVNAGTKINSVGELIAVAKERPNGLTYATAGTGTAPHMSGELFNLMTGAKLRHVPYRGNVQAVADLIGGHVEVMFPPAPLVVPQRNEIKAEAAGRHVRPPDAPVPRSSLAVRNAGTGKLRYGALVRALGSEGDAAGDCTEGQRGDGEDCELARH